MLIKLAIFVCIFLINFSHEEEFLRSNAHNTMFENITDPTKYNKWITPTDKGPILINVSIYLYSFGTLDETNMKYTLQLVLRLSWKDNRLEFEKTSYNFTKLEGGLNFAERIWLPQLHIPNNVEPGVLQELNSDPILIYIYNDGSVYMNRRIQLNAFCKLNFRIYPLDKQTCTMELESSTITKERLVLQWTESQPFILSDGFSLNGFNFKNYSLMQSSTDYKHTGTFSKLVVKFSLQREFGHYFIDMYAPAIMFVITSWITFWIDIAAAPARITLAMTTMLTLVTSAKAAREKLPPVSDFNSFEIWNIICTCFVFAVLIEYAVVNYIYNRDKTSKKRRARLEMKKAMSTLSLSSMVSDMGTIRSTRSLNFNINENNSNNNSNNNKFTHLMPPPSPKAPKLQSLFDQKNIKDHEDGGIEFTVPNSTAPTLSRNTSKNTLDSIMPVFQPPIIDNSAYELQDIALAIDKKSRIFFPFCFTIFNIIYWTTLALLSSS